MNTNSTFTEIIRELDNDALESLWNSLAQAVAEIADNLPVERGDRFVCENKACAPLIDMMSEAFALCCERDLIEL